MSPDSTLVRNSDDRRDELQGAERELESVREAGSQRACVGARRKGAGENISGRVADDRAVARNSAGSSNRDARMPALESARRPIARKGRAKYWEECARIRSSDRQADDAGRDSRGICATRCARATPPALRRLLLNVEIQRLPPLPNVAGSPIIAPQLVEKFSRNWEEGCWIGGHAGAARPVASAPALATGRRARAARKQPGSAATGG